MPASQTSQIAAHASHSPTSRPSADPLLPMADESADEILEAAIDDLEWFASLIAAEDPVLSSDSTARKIERMRRSLMQARVKIAH